MPMGEACNNLAVKVAQILRNQNNTVVLDVNGLGYEIFASNNTLDSLPPINEVATVYTYLHVREDAYLLFGFATKQEKEVFLKLISVSGVGAKTAIQILSGITPNNLINAIMLNDIKTISSVKGLGKKTAERIIVELKNNLGELQGLAAIPLMNYMEAVSSSASEEAVEALVSMGLTKMEAVKLVSLVATAEDTTERIIEKALRNMK